MEILHTPHTMQQWSLAQRAAAQSIAFVPTMGALHEGHLSLLREGKKRASRLVLSLFVNPTQFGPNEDFSKYPRTLESDLEMARQCGVDSVFFPTPQTMYPAGTETFVEVGPLADLLCGKSRPGHFRGVATVVLKLFQIVQPQVALFGLKDYQQFKIIERMTVDFNLPIEIVGMPIVREQDGLAMSSRNRYLSETERKRALHIPRTLVQAQTWAKSFSAQDLTAKVRQVLEPHCDTIDYILLCDPKTLQPLDTLKTPALLAVACFVGKTRLIDNVILA